MGVHVVVGGGSGIGEAVAAGARELGDEVVVWDIAGERDVTCDLADPAAIAAAVAAGPLPERLTISAGIGHAAPLVALTADDVDRVMAVNVRGPLLVMAGLAARAIEAGAAPSFVVVTSVSARLVDRGMGAYCASKAAADMVVQVAAAEWGGHGIRVNAVAPGVTRTPMLRAPADSPWLAGVARRTSLGRLGTADDVAGAVLAVHELAWVTGQVIAADGGLSLQSPIDAWSRA